jgi:hypothetical protein
MIRQWVLIIGCLSSLVSAQKIEERLDALERKLAEEQLNPKWQYKLGMQTQFQRYAYQSSTFLVDADAALSFQDSPSLVCRGGAGLSSELYELLCRKEIGVGIGFKAGRKALQYVHVPTISSKEYQSRYIERSTAIQHLSPYGDGVWLDYALKHRKFDLNVDLGLSNGPQHNDGDFEVEERDRNHDKFVDAGFSFDFDQRLRLFYRHSSGDVGMRLMDHGGGFQLRYEHEYLFGLWTLAVSGMEKRYAYSSSVGAILGLVYQPIFFESLKDFHIALQAENHKAPLVGVERVYSYGIGYKSADNVSLIVGGSLSRNRDAHASGPNEEQGFLAKLAYSI